MADIDLFDELDEIPGDEFSGGEETLFKEIAIHAWLNYCLVITLQMGDKSVPHNHLLGLGRSHLNCHSRHRFLLLFMVVTRSGKTDKKEHKNQHNSPHNTNVVNCKLSGQKICHRSPFCAYEKVLNAFYTRFLLENYLVFRNFHIFAKIITNKQ